MSRRLSASHECRPFDPSQAIKPSVAPPPAPGKRAIKPPKAAPLLSYCWVCNAGAGYWCKPDVKGQRRNLHAERLARAVSEVSAPFSESRALRPEGRAS